MQVYIDDELIGTYVDPDPVGTGDFVSFRSGNATMEVDDFTVYRSRYPSVDVHVGPTVGDDIRMENPNPNTSSGRVMSIIKDNRSEEHTSELQSRPHLVCRLLLEKKKNKKKNKKIKKHK